MQKMVSENKPPEYASELHSSNRILGMDAKIKEIIDYSKGELTDIEDPRMRKILQLIIDKLDKI